MNTCLVLNILNYIDYLESLSLKVSLYDPLLQLLGPFPALAAYGKKNFRNSHKENAEEFMFPIKDGDNVIAFVCVSKGDLFNHYPPPVKNYIEVLSVPLCHMCHLLYIQFTKTFEQFIPPYKKVLAFLSENYAKNLSLTEIARRFHYSESYLRHLFKSKTGYTIGNYRMALRIFHAKKLLKTTELSISEIAFTVGFNDPDYFTCVFHKETGFSPKKYRLVYSIRT